MQALSHISEQLCGQISGQIQSLSHSVGYLLFHWQYSGYGIRCFFTPWIRDDFSWSRIRHLFWWNFLTKSWILVILSSWNYLLLKHTPETISSKKKVCLVLLSPFYIGLRIRIRDEKMLGSGIKHPVFVALIDTVRQNILTWSYCAC
jgi:hypothetical protein